MCLFPTNHIMQESMQSYVPAANIEKIPYIKQEKALL